MKLFCDDFTFLMVLFCSWYEKIRYKWNLIFSRQCYSGFGFITLIASTNWSRRNIGTQGVQEFFCELKGSEIAELNRLHLKCFIKQTTVIWYVSIQTSFYFLTGNLIRSLIQPRLWLVWHAHMHNSPSLTDLIALSTPRWIFAQKYLIFKLRELFAFYTSRKFTSFYKTTLLHRK